MDPRKNIHPLTWIDGSVGAHLYQSGLQGAKPKAEVVANILNSLTAP